MKLALQIALGIVGGVIALWVLAIVAPGLIGFIAFLLGEYGIGGFIFVGLLIWVIAVGLHRLKESTRTPRS